MKIFTTSVYVSIAVWLARVELWLAVMKSLKKLAGFNEPIVFTKSNWASAIVSYLQNRLKFYGQKLLVWPKIWKFLKYLPDWAIVWCKWMQSKDSSL